ncbi:Protein MAIN-LIKE 2 [Linum perenne]
MTWLRNHFGTIRDDADQETIEQHCRAYILDFFGSCIFADRSGSHASLFFLPLLEDMSQIGEYAWGAAALSWLYRELGQCDFRIRIKLLQTEIHTMYGRQISYKKAWNGKQRAMERIYGNWEESYNELPTLMKAIQDRNYGTEVEFVTKEITTDDGDTITQFDRVFWSFAPSIEGFKHCPPVLVVDGTFMTGKYKHTLLMASSFDGNKNIFTVAFAIVDVESKETWEWFFDCIQRRVTQRRGVCVISDRHVGIVSAMEKIQSGWHWRWCARHYVSNYNKAAKNPRMKSRLMNLGKYHDTPPST